MTSQNRVYITLEWQEQSPTGPAGRRVWQQERKILTPNDYPERLVCHNPECEDGGFEIGERIAALLNYGQRNEQNSLVCRNAIHPDRTKRCLHTIIYSIACIRPFQREKPRTEGGSQTAPISDRKVA